MFADFDGSRRPVTGKAASHFFLYFVDAIEQAVVVVRIVHDAMDMPRQWRKPSR